jgi:hypothetical protein
MKAQQTVEKMNVNTWIDLLSGSSLRLLLIANADRSAWQAKHGT